MKRISFFADQYVNLVGWGLDYKSEIQAYERTNALQVMSLSVNAKDDCEKFFTPEALEKLGVDIEERHTLRENLKYNFTAEMACVEHPFDISQGKHSRNKLYIIVHSMQNVCFQDHVKKIQEVQ